MIKKILFILFLFNILLTDTRDSNSTIRKIDKQKHSGLFKQARLLERNGLFNESKLIYIEILNNDPSNKVAFNKIKVILKNEEDFNLLKDLSEKYAKSQAGNPIAKIDLLEAYLISNDKKWETLCNEIFHDHLQTNFVIKVLFNKLLEYNRSNSVNHFISVKRKDKKHEAFYSLEMGNYYISRINYENAISEFLIFLNKNPSEYNKVSNKILSIPDYEVVQENIRNILEGSSLNCAKILLSDLAFKAKEFTKSYNLLKNNFQDPRQLLDFAYQNKKINNYELAIDIYKDLIEQNYNSQITISAILEMADTFEKKSINSKLDLPISQYFYNNELLSPPYTSLNTENFKALNEAISLYDSLYSITKGADAGFRLAEIKFSFLNDLDESLNIYNECIKYSKNKSIKFKSLLRKVDVMIAKGDLIQAKKILNDNKDIYKKTEEVNLLAIKNIQIDFLNMESSISDSISNAILNIPKDNHLYNDLLEIQSLIFSFKDNSELLREFSKIQFLIFQNKRMQAINELRNMYNNSNSNIINDFIIHQISYLLLLNENTDDAINYLDQISHNTIFSEFSYILKAEIFDFLLNDKKNAVNLYLDFLNKYPLSIFYDDIRFRLRDLANND